MQSKNLGQLCERWRGPARPRDRGRYRPPFAQRSLSDNLFAGHHISRVLRNTQRIEMTWLLLSTPCVKTGFLPELLSRLGRDKSEGHRLLKPSFNSLLESRQTDPSGSSRFKLVRTRAITGRSATPPCTRPGRADKRAGDDRIGSPTVRRTAPPPRWCGCILPGSAACIRNG